MSSIPVWLVIILLLVGIAVPVTVSDNVEVAAAPAEIILTYGPGHENHQYASWDNGDGTHSVACDCGIEKRIEYHADNDADGLCDSCGSPAPWDAE